MAENNQSSKMKLYPADIMLPQSVQMPLWSIVACDQYTSEPKYWSEAEKEVGGSPSTLKLVLPEIYLEDDDVEDRIISINQTMETYINENNLYTLQNSYVYVQRTLQNGKVRHGLVGMLDLEDYDYTKGSTSLIRATEGTILDRIPPRVKVRENAYLELPHIMVLIDDREGRVIEPLKDENLPALYNFDLMQNSGSIIGYALGETVAENINRELDHLADQCEFNKKYCVHDEAVLLFAMGDGNHSLATAKACFEKIKSTLPKDEWENHPARYALVEIVNIHDEALDFEPIHRVLFDVESDMFMEELAKAYNISFNDNGGQSFEVIYGAVQQTIYIENPSSNLSVGTLQNFIDGFIKANGGRVDYIHGEDVVKELGSQKGNMGFLLPNMEKNDLFKTVILDGALPRKTFSMGHAPDKRFYLECRKIK